MLEIRCTVSRLLPKFADAQLDFHVHVRKGCISQRHHLGFGFLHRTAPTKLDQTPAFGVIVVPSSEHITDSDAHVIAIRVCGEKKALPRFLLEL